MQPPSESGRLPLPGELGLVDHPQAAPLEVFTDENFQAEVLDSDLPVLVDFWAPTCVPCKLQEPVIRRLALELEGRVRVGRLDVFANDKVAGEHNIRGVPHLILFKAGEAALDKAGDHSLQRLRELLEAAL
jgi:thioredoxin 1